MQKDWINNFLKWTKPCRLVYVYSLCLHPKPAAHYFYKLSLFITDHPSSCNNLNPTEKKIGRCHNFSTRQSVLTSNFSSPAGDGDFYFGGGDVSGDRVEVVHRRHVLQFVHNVSLHHLHLHRQSGARWLGSDPGSAQPGSDGARRVSGDSGDSRDQIRDQTASGPSRWGSHFTDVGAGGGGIVEHWVEWTPAKKKKRGRQRRTWLTVHAAWIKIFKKENLSIWDDCCALTSHGEVVDSLSLRLVFGLCAQQSVWREKGSTQTHPSSSSHTELHSRPGNPANDALVLLQPQCHVNLITHLCSFNI